MTVSSAIISWQTWCIGAVYVHRCTDLLFCRLSQMERHIHRPMRYFQRSLGNSPLCLAPQSTIHCTYLQMPECWKNLKSMQGTSIMISRPNILTAILSVNDAHAYSICLFPPLSNTLHRPDLWLKASKSITKDYAPHAPILQKNNIPTYFILYTWNERT